MKRKQFTFYYSFFDVIDCIAEPAERAQAYDVLCRYALLGEMPDFAGLSQGAKMAVKAFMPVLDAAWKKAANGAAGGSKPKSPPPPPPPRYQKVPMGCGPMGKSEYEDLRLQMEGS